MRPFKIKLGRLFIAFYTEKTVNQSEHLKLILEIQSMLDLLDDNELKDMGKMYEKLGAFELAAMHRDELKRRGYRRGDFLPET